MNHSRTMRARAVTLLGGLSLALAACGGADPAAVPAPTAVAVAPTSTLAALAPPAATAAPTTIPATAAPPAAGGTTSGLSNADLLAKAAANMQTLESYHFEVQGGVPDDSLRMSPNTHMVGDIESHGKAARISVSDEANSAVWLQPGGDRHYESYDGGKTWMVPTGDSGLDFMIGILGSLWHFSGPFSGIQLVGGLQPRDGTPASEVIAGTATRHMTAEAPQMFIGATSLQIWVSTEISPTIRRMRIEGSRSMVTNKTGLAHGVAFSPDGTRLAVAHEDGAVRVWDLTKAGAEPAKLKMEGTASLGVAFSPDGKTLAAGAYAAEPASGVYLWDAADLSKAPRVLATGSPVRAIAFRPDGQVLAAGADNGVYLWDAPFSGAKPAVIPFGDENNVQAVAFSPDNSTLATGDDKDGVRLYDTRHLDAEPTLLGGRWVPGLAFSPDGRFLASNEARLWSLDKAGAAAVELPGSGGALSYSVAFSPDSRQVAISGTDGTIQIWSVAHPTAAPRVILDTERSGGRSLAFSPDGKQLATARENGAVQLWDIQHPEAAPTPTVFKEDERATDTPYSVTWTWSRFNEDLGPITAPAPDTITKP
ncbi:MAG TPA: WD40 repeat domain-containing protein [Chloroflexia bacterium]|nr:WD40 repeat domain-containing protein [Chloroflexia bacterium]